MWNEWFIHYISISHNVPVLYGLYIILHPLTWPDFYLLNNLYDQKPSKTVIHPLSVYTLIPQNLLIRKLSCRALRLLAALLPSLMDCLQHSKILCFQNHSSVKKYKITDYKLQLCLHAVLFRHAQTLCIHHS